MCGIAGVMEVGGAPPDDVMVKALQAALRHRGPDGEGLFREDSVALVHTRLAIIDLAGGGHPLHGNRGTALVANGEIYNDPELRAGLLADAPYRTGSDCESILHLYERYGCNGLRRLRGMFAFALFDPAQHCLILGRDPFGIKPCYYVETPRRFAFASEPQALLAAGLVEPGLVSETAIELLQLQFTTGRETIFKNIYRLLPGEVIVVRQGRICERMILPALPTGSQVDVPQLEALERLDQTLMDSIEVHQRSDVPFGLFLSSGIDSSAILACMSRLSGNGVEAFTASFPATAVADEFDDANSLAKALGARHHRVEITARDFFRTLPQIAACVDDPTADYAVVPTYILAEEAAKSVKVILCGEGGDELFAGYGRYRRQIKPWWLGGRKRRGRGPFSNRSLTSIDNSEWRRGIVAAERSCSQGEWTLLQQAQAVDCVDFLPHGLLTKLDRCLMAHGVEGRTPLLDRRVAELAFRLPTHLKIGQRRGKYLLRRWLDGNAPAANAFARKKGFTVPVGQWIAQEGQRLGDLLARDPAIEEICPPDITREIFSGSRKSDADAAWRLMFYALWHRRHLRGQRNDGDVFECLAES